LGEYGDLEIELLDLNVTEGYIEL